MTEEETKQLDDLSRAVFERITQFSVSKVNLDTVRKDRNLRPEDVSDAAKDYRVKEAAVTEALNKLIEFQCSIMTKEN